MTTPPHHQGHQRDPKNLPWNRADANCDRHATLAMARLPNTPRPPKLAARIPGPASVRAEAVERRPPAPATRAVAMRGDANERPAKLRPPSARPPICDPPKRATLKERRPTPAPPKRVTPTERAPTPIPPKRATPKERAPPEASSARGKAAAVAAKAPAVPAKASAVPAKASAAPACVGFKREKRNGEEQHRDSANAGHRPPAVGERGGRRPRGRRNAPTPIPGPGELLRRRLQR